MCGAETNIEFGSRTSSRRSRLGVLSWCFWPFEKIIDWLRSGLG
jgi:hypothetical protein